VGTECALKPQRTYRNIDRNAEITPQLEDAKIEQPALFIAGKKDLVLSFSGGTMIADMEKRVPELRGKVIVEGAGHWVQAEKPGPVNEALIPFLKATQ
jgi:pimeloyl-ACP methyl ester carboxylesterase